jgi:hypothetical protein
MSALLSEADMRVAPAYVYFGPKADIPECLFNHLIGSIQYAIQSLSKGERCFFHNVKGNECLGSQIA